MFGKKLLLIKKKLKCQHTFHENCISNGMKIQNITSI